MGLLAELSEWKLLKAKDTLNQRVFSVDPQSRPGIVADRVLNHRVARQRNE